MIAVATFCIMIRLQRIGCRTMEVADTSSKIIYFKRMTLIICLALEGCASIDRPSTVKTEPVRTTLEHLSAKPENFSGRVVKLSVYVRPYFRGTSLERLQLWSKNVEGNCTTSSHRNYSVSRRDIHNFGVVKLAEDRAFQMELIGAFHFEEVIVNPGHMEFSWDGYLTGVTLKRQKEFCFVQ